MKSVNLKSALTFTMAFAFIGQAFAEPVGLHPTLVSANLEGLEDSQDYKLIIPVSELASLPSEQRFAQPIMLPEFEGKSIKSATSKAEAFELPITKIINGQEITSPYTCNISISAMTTPLGPFSNYSMGYGTGLYQGGSSSIFFHVYSYNSYTGVGMNVAGGFPGMMGAYGFDKEQMLINDLCAQEFFRRNAGNNVELFITLEDGIPGYEIYNGEGNKSGEEVIFGNKILSPDQTIIGI